MVSESTPARKEESEDEKLFRAMEKKILEAKLLRVAFEFVAMQGGEEGIRMKGTLQLSTDNKLRIDAEGAVGGKKEKVLAVCNGKQLLIRDAAHPASLPMPMSDALGLASRALMTRIGAFGALAGSNPNGPPIDISELFSVSEFKFAGIEKVGKTEARIVSYSMVMADSSAKIWIDPTTSLPLRRLMTFPLCGGAAKSCGDAAESSEVYAEFLIDPQLDAKLFELPAAAELK
jgi:hypothetical protein